MVIIMKYEFVQIGISLFSFILCFYSLSSIQFEKFTRVSQPFKVQMLLLVLSMALAYFVSSFLMMFIL